MNRPRWAVRFFVCVLYIGLFPWDARAQLDAWFTLRVPEVSGAEATDLADRVVLVSDDVVSHLFDYNFANNMTIPVNFATDAAQAIDDLEGLTRRPSDRRYFMTASLSRTQTCALPGDARVRMGSLTLAEAAGQFTVQNLVVRGRVADSLREPIITLLPEAAQRAARANHPEQGGLNVEALAFVPAAATPPIVNKDALLLGLRGPLTGTPDPETEECVADREPGGGSAFYVYLRNPDDYLGGAAPELCGPFTLNLNNQGFRDATLITMSGRSPGTRFLRLLVIAGDVGDEGNPRAYLFNTRDPFFSAPVPIALPPDSDGRAIEGAAVLMVGGGERLTLYEDRGGGQPSAAAITAHPPQSRAVLTALLVESFAAATRQLLGKVVNSCPREDGNCGCRSP
jgi:hypothetical protein